MKNYIYYLVVFRSICKCKLLCQTLRNLIQKSKGKLQDKKSDKYKKITTCFQKQKPNKLRHWNVLRFLRNGPYTGFDSNVDQFIDLSICSNVKRQLGPA